jgi:hypothetical protein
MAKNSVTKSQRGHNETTNKGAAVDNFADLPESDKPVDPFENTMVPERDTRGADHKMRDWTGESGSPKG